MRISVTHSTVYRYASPVYLEPHTIRLRPRDDGAQRLSSFAMEISPLPVGQAECLDQDGNVVVEAWFEGLISELTVRTMFTAETLRANPFAFLVRRGMAELPPQYSASVYAELSPYSLDAGIGEPVRQLAAAAAAEAGSRTVDFLSALNQKVYRSLQYVTRDLGPPHPPEETLAEGQGSCRDFAMVFVAACRAVGLAARFVSGYNCCPEHPHQSDMHAWAEVYIEGGGWRAYDPSAGLAVSTSHVAVAAAAAPALAAPIVGAYRGAAPAKMEFAISVLGS